MTSKKIALSVSLMLAAASQSGLAATVVPGTSDPFLAGQPIGTSCCGGDSAPAQSPVLAPVTLVAGEVLSFSTIGGVNYSGGVPSDSADGDNDGTHLTYPFSMTTDYGTGISGAQNVNVDGLVGVFLDDSVPSGPAPAALDFGSGLDFASLAPGLDQIFWIGDGLTGLGTGSVQQFTVPTGATRLFLGTVDGFQWSNNTGAITVTIAGAAGAVPEPATWALMLVGFGAIGLAARQRAKVRSLQVAYAVA